jgi:hypothetical protein
MPILPTKALDCNHYFWGDPGKACHFPSGHDCSAQPSLFKNPFMFVIEQPQLLCAQ